MKESLKELQKLPLMDKIQRAHRIISETLSQFSHPIVAWSGGKDSTVLLHLVLQHNPSIPVIFNDTGVEFPETYEFIKQMEVEWNLTLYRTKPAKTFWQCVKEYGWPLGGKKNIDHSRHAQRKTKVQRALSGLHVSSRCCHYLKERPAKEMYTSLGINVVFCGLLAHESRNRALAIMQKGEVYYRKKQRCWQSLPLACWTDEDIRAYHRLYNVPYSRLYDMGHDRNGCWPCGMSVRYGRYKALRESHPKLFRFLMVEKGMGREILKLR